MEIIIFGRNQRKHVNPNILPTNKVEKSHTVNLTKRKISRVRTAHGQSKTRLRIGRLTWENMTTMGVRLHEAILPKEMPGGVGHDSQSMPEEIFDCSHYRLIVRLQTAVFFVNPLERRGLRLLTILEKKRLFAVYLIAG